MLFAGLWVWAGAVPEKGRKDTKFRPIDVNMDSIRVNIQNPRSNYYYKRLWRKYQSNDTNMSLKEYRHLYLGYVFSEDKSFARIIGACDTPIAWRDTDWDYVNSRIGNVMDPQLYFDLRDHIYADFNYMNVNDLGCIDRKCKSR